MTSIRDLLQKGKRRSSEDTQLKLALELSKQEHIKEQKKLLEEYTKKTIPKKKRIIEKDEEEEEEDWFQTISSRPQDKNQAKTKKEVVKQEETFEFDLSSIFDNNEQDKFFKDNADNCLPMVSDAESDCSVIDLCNGDANQTKESVEKSMEKNVEKSVGDDDGYLSPLEGFESLNNSEKSQQYFDQFATKPTRKRKTTATTNTNTKRKKPFKRWYKKKTNK